MAFSLNNFNENEGTGSYVSKSLLPGTHYCRILDIKLDTPPYDKEQYNLVFVLEGPKMGDDFVGFSINRLDPSKGTYEGQIASVRSGQYGFKNWVYKEKTISRDESIQTFLGVFLKQIGVLAEFQSLNVSADTIEDLVAEVKAFLRKKDERYYFTIGGQKYYKDGSEYASYSLLLPKKEGSKYAFGANIDDVIEFNESVHVTERVKTETPATPEIQGFGSAMPSTPVFQPNTSVPADDLKL